MGETEKGKAKLFPVERLTGRQAGEIWPWMALKSK